MGTGMMMGVDMGMGMGGGVGLGLNHSAIDPNLDQASFDLIKQLQQEDLGLRRRGSR
jgi:F-box/leucine-rich repeat protein 10/11